MRTELADVVAEHVDWSRSVYRSAEWRNVASALARLTIAAEDLSPRSIRRALARLEADSSLTTGYRRSTWTRWRRFFRWCVEFEHAAAIDLFTIEQFRPRWRTDDKTPTKQGPISLAVVERALPRLSKLDRDLVRLLLFTGARPSELFGLTAAHVRQDLDVFVADLHDHKTAHLGRTRSLVFAGPAARIIDRHLRPFTPHDWLFPAPRDASRPLPVYTVAQRLRRRSAGFTLYDLRRLAARTLREVGGLDVAQAGLGHAHASTTEIYAPVDRSRITHAARILATELGGVA